MSIRTLRCLCTVCAGIAITAGSVIAQESYRQKVPGTPQRTYDGSPVSPGLPIPPPARQDVTDEARALPGKTLELLAPAVDPASAEAADCLEALAAALERNGRDAEALPLFAKALEVRSAIGASPMRLVLSAQHVLRVASRTSDGWQSQNDALAVFTDIEQRRRAPDATAPLVVGIIAGRPVFEHQVLDEIEDELREATNREERDRHIRIWLRQAVLNELFLAEGIGDLAKSLDGLETWTEGLREQIVAQYGGDAAKAEQTLLETEQVTLDAWVWEQLDRAIITKMLRERVNGRVHVTPQEIDVEYRRRHAEYNPPVRGSFGRIVLPGTGDVVRERVERIAGRLALGEDFVTVAEDAGRPGVWATLDLDADGMPSSVKEPVRAHFTELKNEGDVAGPFELSGSTWWLCLLELETPEARPLTDATVRNELEQTLRRERANRLQSEFIEGLLADEAVRYELESMARNLSDRATERYSMATPAARPAR
jgi:hypothetical protein